MAGRRANSHICGAGGRSGRVVEKGAPAAYLGRVDAVQVTSDTWVVADVTVDFAEACP